MMSQYLEEFEQDPFDAHEFIEKLTWRTTNETEKNFDADVIYETFVHTIKDLKILQEKQQKKDQIKDEQVSHARSIGKLQDRHQNSIQCFHELDEKINSVAGKIIHLGEQLENVQKPRSRTIEAQKLLNYMSDFLLPGPIVSDIFTDKSQLFEAADVIQKMYLISQDLSAKRFDDARKKIEKKYDEIERALIEEFAAAQKVEDIEKMKKIANILSQFKGYAQCIDAYIEQSQSTPTGGKDIFATIPPMCRHNYEIIKQVFASPNHVMSKFILNIYQLKLNQFTATKLEDKRDEERYLKTLYELYFQTKKLSDDLQEFMTGSDEDLLNKLTAHIFSKHVSGYIEVELKCLKSKCDVELQKYYASKNHQKKMTPRFQELRRDMQAAIGFGETKSAIKRCKLLSKEQDVPTNVVKIADILLTSLMTDYVTYGLMKGIELLPLGESKAFTQTVFFEVVQKCSIIVHLLEKLYTNTIIPLVVNTSSFSDCNFKKRSVMEPIEMRINTGLERCLNSIVGWVKSFLQSEQKKTDYKPENDVDTVTSAACRQVVQSLQAVISKIKKTLDGENLNSFLSELGIRLHRVIFEHMQTMQYNTAGAMCAICDVNEYRRLIRGLNNPLVNQLFDGLHALCNLLLVKPENIQEVCTGETLETLDKSVVSLVSIRWVIMSFDPYKSQGPNYIIPKMLGYVTQIFIMCLATNYVPLNWRNIPKAASSFLMNVLGRILDFHIRGLFNHGIISGNQHVFLKDKSTETVLHDMLFPHLLVLAALAEVSQGVNLNKG
uniref:Exocyst complex component 5 n=1 Tax=Megaselia scalaris TaxID=36166 RepID=T1GN04_MEGSC